MTSDRGQKSQKTKFKGLELNDDFGSDRSLISAQELRVDHITDCFL